MENKPKRPIAPNILRLSVKFEKDGLGHVSLTVKNTRSYFFEGGFYIDNNGIGYCCVSEYKDVAELVPKEKNSYPFVLPNTIQYTGECIQNLEPLFGKKIFDAFNG